MTIKTIKKYDVIIPTIAFLVIAILVISGILAKIGFWNFIFQILLTVIGIILALWYADLGKPKLILEILAPQKVYIGSVETLFLKLRVFNQPLKTRPVYITKYSVFVSWFNFIS